MAEYVSVAQSAEIAAGQMKQVDVGDKSLLIVNVAGDYFAVDGACTHRGGPLGEGELEGELVTCPWHRGGFNVKTGQPIALPTTTPVATYPVRVVGSTIEVAPG